MTPHPANVRRRIRQLKDYVTVSADWISYALIDDITDAFQPLIQSLEKEVDAIDGAEWIDPACPSCSAPLSPPDVQRLGTHAQEERLNERLMKRALADLDEFRECTKCGVGQLHVGGVDQPIVTCAECGNKTCFAHKVAWHAELTCQQYDEELASAEDAKKEDQENVAVSEELVKSISKPCPGEGCGFYIQKSEGCDHMTCRRCKHEFCYECFASYVDIRLKGNTAHTEECKYYA